MNPNESLSALASSGSSITIARVNDADLESGEDRVTDESYAPVVVKASERSCYSRLLSLNHNNNNQQQRQPSSSFQGKPEHVLMIGTK